MVRGIKPTVGGNTPSRACRCCYIWKNKCIHDDGSELEVGPGDAYYFALDMMVGLLVMNLVKYMSLLKPERFFPWKHAANSILIEKNMLLY